MAAGEPSSTEAKRDAKILPLLPGQAQLSASITGLNLERQDILERELGELPSLKHAALSDPAKQIRLLSVKPGREDDVIICSLSVADIDDAPAYHAISYTWGPQYPERNILVDSALMEVRTACHYAMWQARLHAGEPPALLWIDSICIDQWDDEEKADQVAMIPQIFGRAKATYSCIGPHANKSERLFDHYLPKMRQEVVADADRVLKRDCKDCLLLLDEASMYRTVSEERDPVHGLHAWVTRLPDSDFEHIIDALTYLGRRPYWERMWIYPEVSQSDNVQVLCGDSMADIDGLRWIIAILHWVAMDVPAKSRSADHQALHARHLYPMVWKKEMWKVMVTYCQPCAGPLGGWLQNIGKGLQSSFAFDKIYAAMSVVNYDPHFPVPRVDYRKSAVELSRECLPHLSHAGLGFPQNVRMLLSLISCDVRREDYELGEIWTDRNNPFELEQRALAGRDAPSYGCEAHAPSRTAIWRCSLLHDSSTNVVVLMSGTDGCLTVSVEVSPTSEGNQGTDLGYQCSDDRPLLRGKDEQNRIEVIAGFVTVRAKAGDMLLEMQKGRRRRHAEYFVLRPASNDIYEIVGTAFLLPGIKLSRGHRRRSQVDETIQPGSSTVPVPMCFDLWLDDEDVLAYAFPGGSRQPDGSNEAKAAMVSSLFTRSRFSSFATACFGESRRDAVTSCPDCALGFNRHICIHCGIEMEAQKPET